MGIYDLEQAQRAFLNFTLAKKRECFKDFTQGQADAYSLIPYLLHTSEVKQFSIVDGQIAPCGIYGYQYQEDLKEIGRKYFSSSNRFEEPKAVEDPAILSLSIMGSAGSIAQTEGSDLDYWVCIPDKIKELHRQRLQKKLTAIENWCMSELDAEVHFFISTANDIRNNNFGSVDKESCGTALGKLLKEEYYRTSLHVSGKIPLWWLAPFNGNDECYAQLPALLQNSRIETEDFIDFGNIFDIPRDEFVGGGMWQLNKGIGSPFKSALKMALLVEYSDTTRSKDLLAQLLKKKVFENPGDMEQLDPYLMMVESVISYYLERSEEKIARLLQICLFLKMKIWMSRWWDSKTDPPHRTQRIMLRLLKKWDWTIYDIEKWENFDSLNMKELVELKKQIEDYMFKSLQELRASGTANQQRAVSQEDFKKMTQRLATIFNPDPKRIEWFYKPYDKMIVHRIYSIQEELEDGKWIWNLYTGIIDPEGNLSSASSKKRLRTENSMPELVTWMLYNQIVKPDGKIHIKHRRDISFIGNLKRLAVAYKGHIGKPQLPTLDEDAFAKDPHAVRWLLMVNLVPLMQVEDESEDAEDDESQTPSTRKEQVSMLIAGELAEALSEAGYDKKAHDMRDKSENEDPDRMLVQCRGKSLPLRAGRVPFQEDPLNAGPENCSIYNELFLIELNSWGEIYAYHLNSQSPIADLICKLVKEAQQHPEILKGFRCELGIGPYHQKHCVNRLNNLIQRMVHFLMEGKQKTCACLFQVDGHFHCIIKKGPEIKEKYFETLSLAIQHINIYAKGNVDILIDQENPRLAIHNQFYTLACQHKNALILMESPDGMLIGMVDETGRYLYEAMDHKEFNASWMALVLSFIASVRCWSKQKFSFLRIKQHSDQAENITDKTLGLFKQATVSLPRTQMTVKSREAFMWMLDSHSNRAEHLNQELQSAVNIHEQAKRGQFLLSNVHIEVPEGEPNPWTPIMRLQLRQKLIRSGRKLQNQEMKT